MAVNKSTVSTGTIVFWAILGGLAAQCNLVFFGLLLVFGIFWFLGRR